MGICLSLDDAEAYDDDVVSMSSGGVEVNTTSSYAVLCHNISDMCSATLKIKWQF